MAVVAVSEHNGDLERVRDARGYDCGWSTTCSCGFTGDLRTTHGPALQDLLDHLAESGVRPKETTA